VRLLTHWPSVGVDLQVVLDHLPGNPRHLRRFPCEHVGICLEEGDKREFLFLVQITRNASGLGGIRSEPDSFDGDTIHSGWLYLWRLGGALVPKVEGFLPPSSERAVSAARACSFSTVASAVARSPCTVRTPVRMAS
jgi:hypothetical protein